MMEGVASEAASLAGHLQLDNLCWIYDNNHITIEGNTSIAFTEDTAARFLAYGWNVLRVGDANDIDRIQHALTVFIRRKGGYFHYPRQSHRPRCPAFARHRSAVSRSARREVRLAKRSVDGRGRQVFVPDGVREHFMAGIGARGAKQRPVDRTLFIYKVTYPELARIELMVSRKLGLGGTTISCFSGDAKGISGRDAGRHSITGTKCPVADRRLC
jgi:transketolase